MNNERKEKIKEILKQAEFDKNLADINDAEDDYGDQVFDLLLKNLKIDSLDD